MMTEEKVNTFYIFFPPKYLSVSQWTNKSVLLLFDIVHLVLVNVYGGQKSMRLNLKWQFKPSQFSLYSPLSITLNSVYLLKYCTILNCLY